jgi:histidinol-phosphate phosphatase family protein
LKAVILAGGKGERLKPLTNSIPKALASINGKPIIKAQIDSLALLGITDFIILTGYKAKMIQTYLKSVYKDSNLSIQCFETPEDYSPAERLLAIRASLVGEFLLLYCDNLVSDLESLKQVMSSKSPLTFLAEARETGNLDLRNRVLYEIERTGAAPFVELGYIKVNLVNFSEVLQGTNSLQLTLKKLTRELQCRAVITSNSLISVSNISRFNALRANRKTILLDRDGILNEKMPHRKYLDSLEKYRPLDDNINALTRLFPEYTEYIIISNQPGVATGEVQTEFLEFLHSQMVVELLLKGISVIGVYVCTHHWNENCECRKPKPGMIKQAIQDYELDAERLVYIGDEIKDVEAANAAGVLGVRISDSEDVDSFRTISAAHSRIANRIGK